MNLAGMAQFGPGVWGVHLLVHMTKDNTFMTSPNSWAENCRFFALLWSSGKSLNLTKCPQCMGRIGHAHTYFF